MAAQGTPTVSTARSQLAAGYPCGSTGHSIVDTTAQRILSRDASIVSLINKFQAKGAVVRVIAIDTYGDVVFDYGISYYGELEPKTNEIHNAMVPQLNAGNYSGAVATALSGMTAVIAPYNLDWVWQTLIILTIIVMAICPAAISIRRRRHFRHQGRRPTPNPVWTRPI